MLFDLRGRGRRRVVKTVYVTLALLLGGGLVLFGIGGDVSGGLVDAITERGAGTDDSAKRFQEQEDEALARTQADPEDASAWVALARARYQLAGQGENYDPETQTFTDSGLAELTSAAEAWQEHLEVAENPDERLARLMVQAYIELGDAEEAARAQEVVTEANPDNSSLYAQLAQLSYAAGLTRKGDLAAKKAVQLEEPDMRNALKGQLDQAKSQALSQQLQDATEASPTPGGEASPAPDDGG